MEIFYELMMKNGLCFLAGTNHEGICEFSVDGNEFVIHTITDRNGDFLNFSFSVDTTFAELEAARKESDLQKEYSVLSVKKVDEKRKKHLKNRSRKAEESVISSSFRNLTSGLREAIPSFCARRGCVGTPSGWIYA